MFKKIITFTLILLINIILLELISFAFWSLKISKINDSGVWFVRKALNDSKINSEQYIISHPYSLYWNNPNYINEYGNQYNSKGYRSEEISNERLKQSKIILVYGGSTTNSYPYVKNRKKIWTSLLQQKLRNHFNRNNIFVVNAGLSGATSAEIMVNYFMNGKYLDPKLVILHTGANDVSPLMWAGRYEYKSDYSNIRSSNASVLFRPGEKTILKFSYFARIIYSRWLNQENFTAIVQSHPDKLSKLSEEERLDSINKHQPTAFSSNLEAIIKNVISEKGKALLIPVPFDSNKKSSNYESILLGGKKMMFEMEKIAQKYNQFFFEIDGSKLKSSWFLDMMHLNENGHEEKAIQIYNFIISNFDLSDFQ